MEALVVDDGGRRLSGMVSSVLRMGWLLVCMLTIYKLRLWGASTLVLCIYIVHLLDPHALGIIANIGPYRMDVFLVGVMSIVTIAAVSLSWYT